MTPTTDETPGPPRLAVALTAHDSLRTIPRVLRSLEPLSDLLAAVVVVDSGSTDGTVEHCRAAGARVVSRAWSGYGPQKQAALDEAAASGAAWLLLLDSDEWLEPELAASIARTVRADDPAHDGWAIRRRLRFLGGELEHVLQPDEVLRLVRAGRGRMTDDVVHERLTVPGRTGRLAGWCTHDSYASFADHARRQVDYALLASRRARRGGRAIDLVASPIAALVKQLVLKGGWRDGPRGLVAIAMTVNAVLLKHAAIAAARIEPPEDDQAGG